MSLTLFPFASVDTDPRTAAPRPPNLSSVPALLSSLQNEYDAIMLEMFNLKKLYEGVRQELAHALYANDAANRVVARLLFERDQAREALVNIQSSLGGSANPSGSRSGGLAAADSVATGPVEDAEMQDPKTGLPGDVAAIIDATVQSLSSDRRTKVKRKTLPEGYVTADALGSLKVQSKSVIGSARTAKKGLTSLDISPNGRLGLAASNDKDVELVDNDKLTATPLKGHKKPVFAAEFAKGGVLPLGPDAKMHESTPSYFVTASEDETIKVWKRSSDVPEYEIAHDLSGFSASVAGVAVHPSGQFFAIAFRDGTFALHSISTGKLQASVNAPSDEDEAEGAGGYAYETVKWHPDGQLLALGTAQGVVRVWDIKSLSKAATLRASGSEGGPVQTIDFSENGYYVAFALRGSRAVKVWDLRKLNEAASIENSGESSITAVKFDPSTNYLAVATETSLRIYANKSWKELATLKSEEAAAEGEDERQTDTGFLAIQWDPTNGDIFTAGLDRNLRRWSHGGVEQAS